MESRKSGAFCFFIRIFRKTRIISKIIVTIFKFSTLYKRKEARGC